jgi:hypothetical protein
MDNQIFELRQYTLHPGKRDALIELFEREFLEPQEAAGIRVLGQFYDLDDADRFVWFRSFPDMVSRKEALTRFYTGPVWQAYRDEANATMIDSDNVLLLRPSDPRFLFPTHLESLPLLLTVHEAAGDDAEDLIAGAVVPLLRTEHSENTFPRLPVRAGENVVISFSAEGLKLPVQQRLRLEPTPKSALR